MGSPLSPIIADMVMQDLEESVLNTLDFNLVFYYRYVDDIILAAHSENIEKIVNKFNKYHERLRFTIEYEVDRSLSFLDLKLIVIDNILHLDWFHKKTFSGRTLSYFSNHPNCQKIGTIYSLVDRAILLSHPSFHKKNLELVINILLDNGYPLNFIFNAINKRINNLIVNKLNNNANDSTVQQIKSRKSDNNNFFVIPYIDGMSSLIASVIRKPELTVGYRVMNKLNKFVRVQKDKNNHSSNSNVIYKINCNDCNASYVGQTKRMLRTRLKEHINNVRLDPSRHSVISEHILNNKHTFDWNNIKILDHENNYHKRLISEMIHIKEQKNGINLNKDTELLDEVYFDILDELADF